MGKILSYKHGSKSVKGVDPRLWDIVQHGIAASPYDAVIRSGSESRGKSDKGNHMEGYAIDVTLYDPQTGEKLADTAKAGNKGATFGAYEQYAQAARVYQKQTYPELDHVFRWGGGFSSGGTPGDLMHIDITPKAKGSMAYYNWDTGLNSAGKSAFPNAQSNGGLGGANGTRLVAQYQQAIEGSGGLVPPANIPAVGSQLDVSQAPTPRRRPAGIDAPSVVPMQRPVALGGSLATTGLHAPPTTDGPAYPRGTLGAMRKAAANAVTNPAPLQQSTGPAPVLQTLPPPPMATLGGPSTAGALGDIHDRRDAATMAAQQGSPRANVPVPKARNAVIGLIEPGNIDVQHRPVYFGNDGTYGTEQSFSIGTDKGEVLLPQIVNGKLVSQQEAVQHYKDTGEHLGIFATPEAADAFATQLHERNQGLGNMPVPMPGRPASLSTPKATGTPAKTVPTSQDTPQAKTFARLPSGKMVAEGTYPSSNEGSTVTITRGPDGSAIIVHNNPGLMNTAKMGPGTVAGGVIKGALGNAAPAIGNALGDASSSVGSTVSSYTADPGRTLGDIGNNPAVKGIGNFLGQAAIASPLGGIFTLASQPARPTLADIHDARDDAAVPFATTMGRPGMFGQPKVAKNSSGSPDDRGIIRPPVIAPKTITTKPVAVKAKTGNGNGTQQPAAQTFKGSSTGRIYTVGKVYQDPSGKQFTASANGKFVPV